MRIPGVKTVKRHAWRLRGRLMGGDVILGYHRVAEDREDPHRLCVGPAHFEEQLDVLRVYFDLVTLSEVARGTSLRPSTPPIPEDGHPTSPSGAPRRLATLTFDDGYSDVLAAALPRVERAGAPMTVFVVADCVGEPRFPWDRDRGGVEGRPLTAAELRTLSEGPGVEIGAHTVTHPDLTALAPSEVRREVADARRRLEGFVSHPVRIHSYPHGGVNRQVRAEVHGAGYELACASRPGLVTASTDPLRLPRLWPPDPPGPAFERWLASWAGIRPASGIRSGEGGSGSDGRRKVLP
jgi:peptidoglycan/xylan/chitin deacetylase (PgdA/CDA1 family)